VGNSLKGQFPGEMSGGVVREEFSGQWRIFTGNVWGNCLGWLS